MNIFVAKNFQKNNFLSKNIKTKNHTEARITEELFT